MASEDDCVDEEEEGSKLPTIASTAPEREEGLGEEGGMKKEDPGARLDDGPCCWEEGPAWLASTVEAGAG